VRGVRRSLSPTVHADEVVPDWQHGARGAAFTPERPAAAEGASSGGAHRGPAFSPAASLAGQWGRTKLILASMGRLLLTELMPRCRRGAGRLASPPASAV
jgi:hypothetical protein